MKKNPLLLAFGGLLAMAAGIGVGRFVYTPILPPMLVVQGTADNLVPSPLARDFVAALRAAGIA